MTLRARPRPFPRRAFQALGALACAAALSSPGAARAGDGAEKEPSSSEWAARGRALASAQAALWRQDQSRALAACPAARPEAFSRLDQNPQALPPPAECLQAASGFESANAAAWGLSVANAQSQGCWAAPAPFSQRLACARGWAVFGVSSSQRAGQAAFFEPLDEIAWARWQEARALRSELGPLAGRRPEALAEQARELWAQSLWMERLGRAQALAIARSLRERSADAALEEAGAPKETALGASDLTEETQP